MRIAVVQFPGSNCERETTLAIERAGMQAVPFLWNEPVAKLHEMDGFVIVGGFSYEDRSRAGIIASLDPVMREIAAQSELGKPILGICNGAQILIESGLVPGLEGNKPGMALTENKRIAHDKILGTGYYNAWVHIRLSDFYQHNAFTRCLSTKDILRLPVAHAEGRFVMQGALLLEMQSNGLNLFQYCDAEGQVLDQFPVNPNGSINNIAAVSNKSGNVMAMMPHPERTLAGDAIFESMKQYIDERRQPLGLMPLHYYPRQADLSVYSGKSGSHQTVVALTITDNQALTVQNTLRQLGIPVTVRRYTHWEIDGADSYSMQTIKASEVLYNTRKEREITLSDPSCPAFLVRAKDDLLGQQKLQSLRDHFSLSGVQAIHHGVIWRFEFNGEQAEQYINQIMQTNIIRSPYAHDCYRYS